MTLDKWQARSENAIQGAASLESILSVRRELLKLYCPAETKSNISQFLIQVIFSNQLKIYHRAVALPVKLEIFKLRGLFWSRLNLSM